MRDADRGKRAKEASETGPRLSISCMEFSEGTRCSWNSRRRGPARPRLHGSANFLPALITSSSTLYQTRVYRRTVLRPLSALPASRRISPFLYFGVFPKVPPVSLAFASNSPKLSRYSFRNLDTRNTNATYTDDAKTSVSPEARP